MSRYELRFIEGNVATAAAAAVDRKNTVTSAGIILIIIMIILHAFRIEYEIQIIVTSALIENDRRQIREKGVLQPDFGHVATEYWRE